MSDTVTTASVILTVVLMTLSVIMLLWVLNFYRLRDLREIASRRPKSSLLVGILCTAANMIVIPGCMLYLNNKQAPHIPLLAEFLLFGLMLTIMASYHILTFRAWMVYFDIKFNEVLEDQQWRLYIDPKENNWYLKNRHKWGSQKRVALILLAHWSLFSLLVIISVVMYGPGNQASRLFIGTSALFPMFFDFYLYLKFPTFHDNWGIHKEIKYTLRAELVQQVGYYVMAFGMKPEYETIEYFYSMLFVGLTTFIYVVVIQLWVFIRFKLPIFPCYGAEYVKQRYIHDEYSVNLSSRADPDANDNENKKKRISLKIILQDEYGFNEYARHLTREFCVENLMFWIETQQWKQALFAKNEYSQFNESRYMQIKIPDNAPKSRIVESEKEAVAIKMNTDKTDSFPTTEEYIQAVKLFKKYVVNDGYFTINVSYESRNALYEAFSYSDSSPSDEAGIIQMIQENKSMDRERLFYLFDKPRKEVYTLLTHGFFRFKTSIAYEKLHQRLADDDK